MTASVSRRETAGDIEHSPSDAVGNGCSPALNRGKHPVAPGKNNGGGDIHRGLPE